MATTKKTSSPKKKTNTKAKTPTKKTTTKKTSSVKKPTSTKKVTPKKTTSPKKKTTTNIKKKTSNVNKKKSTSVKKKTNVSVKKKETKVVKKTINLGLIIQIGIVVSLFFGATIWSYSNHLKYIFNIGKNEDLGVFKDIDSPIIECDDITINEGDKVNLLDYPKVSDNYDKNLNIKVIGDYDMNKAGTYKITFEATDSSNNKTTKEVNLIVQSKPTKKKDTITNFTTSKGYKGYTKNGITYIDGVLVVNKTYSLPSNYGSGLTSTTIAAFNEMKAAALTEGLTIDVVSGFRSYSTQRDLYNSYVNRDGKELADTYSARPGYSEHQSGLAMDINMAGDAFNNTPEAKWLSNNAYKYGFILRYPEGKTNETGYKYESWHYRYVGIDLATKLYNNGDWITLESYYGITSNYSN